MSAAKGPAAKASAGKASAGGPGSRTAKGASGTTAAEPAAARAAAAPAKSRPAAASARQRAAAASAGDASGSRDAAERDLRRAERARRAYERAEVRRFTKRSRRRRTLLITAFGSVALLAGLVAAIAYSPIMALRDIRVEGASRLDAGAIVEAIDGELGTPLPLVDGAEVHRALSGFSLIERYTTESIPPGTLVVRIVERQPVGVLEGSGGYDVVDAAGVVIEHLDARPEGMPLLVAPGGIADDGFLAATAVVRALPEDVRAALVQASAETADDVRLELGGGAEVVWGSPEDSEVKAEVLAALMRAAPPDTVSSYDVSSPSSPVTG
ncbi:FtsQ-type POTRA domain-containing protein [Agromyces archimandritae]|uniref:FtsQ-type POTRA domain-containing protein n=1 Tax=Agromyces archimandritae TaxID=2781962 RepID=A0A975FPN0_9MICO|nr:FtsQ-type POTRA domain-containing protein [Agromyces archimandritae]